MAGKEKTLGTTVLSRVDLVKKPAATEQSAAGEAELLALQAQYAVPSVDLSCIRLDLKLLDWLPKATAQQHLMLPIAEDGESLVVVMANPANARAVEEFEFVTGKDVRVCVAPEEAITSLIEQAYQALRHGEAWFEGCGYVHNKNEARAPTHSQTPLSRNSSHSSAPGDAGAPSIPSLRVGESTPDVLELDTDGHGTVDAVGGVALIVEDDEAIRTLVAIHLRKLGLQTVEAQDGQEALDFLSHSVPTLAVIDAMLPRVHGFEIVKRIRDMPTHSAVAIIVLTAVHRGWRFAEDLRRVSQVKHYIEKPFTANVLVQAVREALGESPRSYRNPAARAELERGVQLLRQGEVAAARDAFRAGLVSDPHAYLLHYHLGLALERLGHVFEAIGAIERAVALCPRYFVGVKNLAVLYHRAGFQSKSTEMWERALALAPEEKTREAIRSHLLRLF